MREEACLLGRKLARMEGRGCFGEVVGFECSQKKAWLCCDHVGGLVWVHFLHILIMHYPMLRD